MSERATRAFGGHGLVSVTPTLDPRDRLSFLELFLRKDYSGLSAMMFASGKIVSR